MDKNCRICLDGFKCLTIHRDLFDEENAHLLSQIRSITGMQIEDIEGHPNQICNICLLDLGCAIQFRERCLISQKQLSEQVNTIEVKNEADKDIAECDPLSLVLIEEADEYKDNDVTESVEQPHAIDFVSQLDAVDNEEKPKKRLKRKTTDAQTAIKPIKVPRKVGPFVCDECGKSIKDQSNFREHKLRHSGNKKFKCKECPKGFYTHKELILHIRRHTGERPFICKYCPTTAADLGTMREHERRHINYRPFECSECGKCFVSATCLSRHRIIHKPSSRTHNCEICDVAFQRIDHLRVHMKSRSHKEKAQAENLEILSSLN